MYLASIFAWRGKGKESEKLKNLLIRGVDGTKLSAFASDDDKFTIQTLGMSEGWRNFWTARHTQVKWSGGQTPGRC